MARQFAVRRGQLVECLLQFLGRALPLFGFAHRADVGRIRPAAREEREPSDHDEKHGQDLPLVEARGVVRRREHAVFLRQDDAEYARGTDQDRMDQPPHPEQDISILV